MIRFFYIKRILPCLALALFGCAVSATAEPPVFNATQAPSPVVPASVPLCGQNISLDREDMFERYDRELTSLVYGHSSTLLMLKRANKIFPVIAPILKKNGMPDDLLYLACVESTLNPRAVSPAKAAGIWQFMPATAKQYGLEVSDEVDERYNIEKATEAACRMLKSSYKKYGDWPTVMAAYNAGPGRISGELEKQMQNTSFDLFLNDETSRYVFRIMALGQIFRDPEAYGFKLYPEQLYMPSDCDVVEVSEPVDDWCEWAVDHFISYAQLKEENPWIRDRKLTNKNNKTYKVKVPKKDSQYRSKNGVEVFDKQWITRDAY